MRSDPRNAALFLLCLTLAVAVPELIAKNKGAKIAPAANDERRAVHALNRLAFGPRPGDVQQVMAMGVDRWIDLQLHPERISDDALESRLAAFRTLRMDPREIVQEFPDGAIIRQVADGKRPMPSDPARRAVYQVQVVRLEAKLAVKEEEKRQQQAEAAQPTAPAPRQDAMLNDPSSAAGTAKTEAELAAAAGTSDAGVAPAADGNAINASAGMSASDPSTSASMDIRSAPVEDADSRIMENRLYADLEVQKLPDLPPERRYRKILSMPANEQVAFADALRGGSGQEFLNGLDPRQKEVLLAMNNTRAVVTDELIEAKLLRAIYSERQLQEVMTDFWFNHFNVFINKGDDHIFVPTYEQDVIRPHALGKFEDLLVATAKSPAMLFYLDNWLSVGPNSMQALGIPAHPGRNGPYRYPANPRPNAKRKQNSGLNENYGRELLELHTLSVNGGYTQRDVTEVAKVFTGWTIDKPSEGGGFLFDPRKHEPGPKFVLGHRIKFKGEAEGMEVLHMLATSPQTAHFLAVKLAERFVCDDPPPALVDRMAKTFLKKKGDIREVLSTLFHSPEFWDESAYRAKMKTPLEFVVSAVRASGADVEDAMPLARQIANMGMPLYGAQPPTGYSMKAETWVSSSALLNRMNFALALASGKIRGAKVDVAQLAGTSPPPYDPALALSTMEAKLLADSVSKQTHDSIVAQMQGQNNGSAKAKPPDASMIAGLLLGSPEFQRR
jgi:uncharacterized protein (DUF1800 family)